MRKREAENPSITRTAVFWTAALSFIFTILGGAILFAVSFDEAADYQDDLLEESVGILARANQTFSTTPPHFEILYMDDDDFEDRYVVDEDEPAARVNPGEELLVHTLHKSGRALRFIVQKPIRKGFQTVEIDGKTYRLAVLTLKNGNRVAAAQRMKTVYESALLDALKAVVPIILLFFLLLILIGVQGWRLLKPLQRETKAVAARSGADLNPIPTTGMPQEILPLIHSMNGLLEKVDELRTREVRFVADAAHELRSPLAALSLQAERLEKEDLPQSARERLSTLRCGIDRAVRQVSQLLALKRAQASQQGAEKPVDTDDSTNVKNTEDINREALAEILSRAIEDVWAEAESKSIEIVVDGLEEDADSGTARALRFNSDDLFTILRNLLENAVRYTPEGGRVDVSVDWIKGEIAVSDTGPGIPAEERRRVFDPFYRVLGTGVSGTGLGLAIVKTLSDKNGASIRLSDARKAVTADGRDARLGLRATIATRHSSASTARL